MPITGTILDVAAMRPDRLAIAGPGPEERCSYGELLRGSKSVFAAVDELHRSQADPPAPAAETGGIAITAVSLTSAFHTARIIAALAGFRSVSATIDPRWPLPDQVRIIVRTGIGVLISDTPELAAELARAGWHGTLLTLHEFLDLESRFAREGSVAGWLEPAVRPGDEPFLMLFSSGTTSAPKAFLKTRQQYRDNFAVSSAHLEPAPGVHTLAPGPVSYSLTLYALIECLASGGSCHVADTFSAITAGSRIQAEAITRLVAVPAVVQAITAAARRDAARFTGLQVIITGGANLSAAIRQSVSHWIPGARLISYYGAAEIGFIGDSRAGDGTLISVYQGIDVAIREPAAPGGRSGVVPEPGPDLPEGELGELWVRAPACSAGYLAATTAQRLRGADGWATVHDQGRIIKGRLSLAGRAGDVVVTGGHKVALPEVERAFETMPGLGQVCAVALPSETLGTLIALAIEARPSAAGAPSKEALIEHARQHLAPQFVPRQWFLVAPLPRTVGGKIRREATRDLIVEAPAGTSTHEPGKQATRAQETAAQNTAPEVSRL